jgi:tetratricopeptide (TPR) repeat protein
MKSGWTLLLAALLLETAAAAAAQPLSHAGCAAPGDSVEPALLERPTSLRKDIGAVHQKITTSSAETQAFYDQGLTFMHHYVFIEAARSFRQALRTDEECAMCWMGLARAEQGLERPEATAAAIAKAEALAPKATPKERAFIALRAQQIEAQAAPPSEEIAKHAAYKAALDKALGIYPDDAELWIIRGNAEEAGPWGRGQFGHAGSIAFYETALVRSPGHLGAHHYLVHSFENIAHHAEAAEHGKIYSAPSPGVAHAQHMYGHVLPRLGRWDEALAQFEKADAIEEAYAKAESLRPGDDWHHLHNLQLLGYTYLRLQRVDDAERTFRRAFDTPARLRYRGAPQASLAEFFLLRGQPEEALAVARALQVDTRTPATRVVATAVEGEALLALGRTEDARKAAARAQKALDAARIELGREGRYLDWFVAPYIQQLETEIALHGKDPADAEASIRKVANDLSQNPRFDAWGEGLFRLDRMAADARRAGRTALAADVEAKMKVIDPDYVPGALSVPGPVAVSGPRQAARPEEPGTAAPPQSGARRNPS